MIWIRLRGLRCIHPCSVVCQSFSEQLSNANEVTGESSVLITVSGLNQQYLIILMYVINIICIFQPLRPSILSLAKWNILPCCIKVFGIFFKVDLFVSAYVPGGIWGKEEFPPGPYSRFPPALKSWTDLLSFSFLFYTSVKIEKLVTHLWKDKAFLALQNRFSFKATCRKCCYILCRVAS